MNLLGKSDQEMVREREANQEKRQLNQQNISRSMQEEPADIDMVDKITKSGLDPGTAEMLNNLLQTDWVLGNLSDAEVHEARWLARTISDEVQDMHPSQDSIWQGELRQYAFDDSAQNLKPLNSAQKTKIFQLILGFAVRVSRSENMEQQEIFRKFITQSITETQDDGSSGGWL